MCNLYSITTNQAAIIALFRVVTRYVGNLAPMPGVFPDYPAPVVRNTDTGRELSMMRWGMPPPPRTGGPPVTNIRNTSSPHWRGWLKPENRCLVPANSFAEYAPEPNPETKKKDVVWFALNDDHPLFAFAGIWTTFNGDRGTKSKPVPGPHQAHSFAARSCHPLDKARTEGQILVVSFDHFTGLASAVGIVLILMMVTWLGLWGPLDLSKLEKWQTLTAGIIALMAAIVAYRGATAKVRHDREVLASETARLRLSVHLRVDFANREIRTHADELADLLREAMSRVVPMPPGVDTLLINEPPELQAVWDRLDLLPKHLIYEIARIRQLIRTINRAETRIPRQRFHNGTVTMDREDLVVLIPLVREVQDRCKFVHEELSAAIEELAPARKLE
jgi:hypothetical protein